MEKHASFSLKQYGKEEIPPPEAPNSMKPVSSSLLSKIQKRIIHQGKYYSQMR